MNYNKDELTYIGNRIRQLRIKSGLTQEQLGEKSNLHYSYIGQVERGDKVPSLKTLKKITKALNTSLDYLLEPEEEYRVKSDRELLKQELVSLLKNRSNKEMEMILNIIRTILDEFDKLKFESKENSLKK
ncbi:MAG: helix-turn-helix transcriptional regulator [Firmicutes bacterium]|nr:helix-turn-helix transcriptional regulator [Bacillota bacterium]